MASSSSGESKSEGEEQTSRSFGRWWQVPTDRWWQPLQEIPEEQTDDVEAPKQVETLVKKRRRRKRNALDPEKLYDRAVLSDEKEVKAIKKADQIAALTREVEEIKLAVWGTTLQDKQQKMPPRPSMHEKPEDVLEWRRDYRQWLIEGDEGGLSLDVLERDWVNVVVDSVEEPSLYLLAATPGLPTTGYEKSKSCRKDKKRGCCSRCCECFGLCSETTLIAALVCLLTFLTIVLPLAMLANLYKRNIDWSDFTVGGVNENNKRQRRRHRAYLKVLSAALLFYVLYTSLSVLEEIKVFRFFLLGALPAQVAEVQERASMGAAAAATSKRDDDELVNEEKGKRRRVRGCGRALKRTLHSQREMWHDLIFLGDNLKRPLLILGMISKVTSLITMFQLTYLTFRTGFTATDMIFNSLALQFILDTDRGLASALRSTISMRRYVAGAVTQLRAEAELIVATPGLVRRIATPATYSFAELVRRSLTSEYARQLATKYPRFLSWLAFEEKRDKGSDSFRDDVAQNSTQSQREVEFRRCCRSEVGHRLLAKFIFVYGSTICFLQIAGNLVCGQTVLCKSLSNKR